MKKIFNKDLLIFVLAFIALFILSFYIDIYTRSLFSINAFDFNNIRCRTLWIGFSISWIILIELLVYIFVYKKRALVLSIIIFLFNILFFAQICFVQQMGKYLIVSDLFLAGEGFQYITSIFSNLNFGMIVTIIINIILIVAINIINHHNNHRVVHNINKRFILIILAISLTFRLLSYINLGSVEKEEWKENYNTKSIYNNFTNQNTSMFVSGFYEYHVRIVYKYFYNLITMDKVALKNDIDKYNNIYGTKLSKNEMSGIFKDKNVIVIMMESIDSWIIDEDTMPTLKHLQDTGLNFTNRYSPFFNGGQTINTEFSLNSAMYAISDKKTIYDIDDVDYSYSLANMLKKNGYAVNSFHANTGQFYNRSNFHQFLGYDNHYSAADLMESGELENDNYYVDSIFMSNDTLMDLFIKDEKFLSFFTTYSAHLPYTENNKVYKSARGIKNNGYSEEEYVYRYLAHDTDESLRILINTLKKKNKLKDTVLVIASDHYVYGYSDSNYVAMKKNVINDRKDLQNTPFIIWSEDIKGENIDTILDTADILPTLLNMLGIEYDPNKYMGTDVFSDTHDDFVWFSDGSYIKSKDCKLSNEAIITKTNYNINKNKNILLTNYYGK